MAEPHSNHSAKKIFIVTGDASADIHAAKVVKALKQKQPDIDIHGVGGVELKSAGMHLIADQSIMGKIGIAGLVSTVQHWQLGRKILKHLKIFQPNAVMLMDYGGFNLWLSAQLKKRGYKVFYFIPPQVWASRPGRINTIKNNVDHVFCIFPFEEKLYQDHGIPVTYVGHPLVGHLPDPVNRQEFCTQYNIDPNHTLVGLLPGSRPSEIKTLLPTILQSTLKLQQQWETPITFLLAKARHLSDEFFNAELAKLKETLDISAIHLTIIPHTPHSIQSVSDVVVCKSGTSTLETALYGTPMVIVYKIAPLIGFLAQKICLLPVIGLPNILTNPYNPIVPELLQGDFTVDKLTATLKQLLNPSEPLRTTMQTGLKDIQQKIGTDPIDTILPDKLLALLRH